MLFHIWDKTMKDHNPGLAATATDVKGTPATVELPDRVENLMWQTRPAPPSAAENALADALQAIFNDEIYELPRVLARLNETGVAPPAGAASWTEENFRAEMRRLGR
jgi:hypothetical protein